MRSPARPASARRTRIALPLVAALLAGCASQAYDPAPPRDVPLQVLRFESALGVEDSYRMLYARLTQCLASSSYRVQPRFEAATGRAWIMVVQGLGLDRYSFLGNRFAARFDLRDAGAGTQVEAAISEPELLPLLGDLDRLVSRGGHDCR